MRTPLRRLAVFVDEPKEGAFSWVLIEGAGEYIEAWVQVEESKEFHDTYHEAMAAGLLALQAQIADLDIGPREAPPGPKAPVKHSGLFGGFGAMRR